MEVARETVEYVLIATLAVLLYMSIVVYVSPSVSTGLDHVFTSFYVRSGYLARVTHVNMPAFAEAFIHHTPLTLIPDTYMVGV